MNRLGRSATNFLERFAALRWQGLELLNFKTVQKMNKEQNVEGLNVSPAIAKPMLPAVFSFVKKLWWCKLLKWHEWTSKAQQGQPYPNSGNMINDFCDYATMYCKRCGHISELSDQFTNKIKSDLCKPSE